MTKEELWKIAIRYKPKSYKVKFRKTGLRPSWAHKPTKFIYCPRPDDPIGLLYCIHEFAHIHLDHWTNKMPVYEMEYEAEQWTIATLRRHGVRVTKEMMTHCKNNVRQYIKEDTKVKPHILRWLGSVLV